MATNFPSSQDNFTNPTSSSSLSSPSHSQQHSDVNDAVEAIQGALLDGAPLHIDDANERIGIGTNSPERLVDIRGASNPEMRFQSTDSTDPFIYFGDQVDAVRAGIGYDVSANELLLRGYNNNTRLTIDSSGNVDVTTGELRIGGTAVGKWTQFTPNWTNFTPGSATENWRYAVVNDMLFIEGRTILASDSSMGTRPEFDLPNSYSLANLGQPFGTVNMLESGVQSNVGTVIPGSTTSLRFNYFLVSASSLVRQADITSNAPFAWGSGDQLRACATVRLM